jgi:hypothetical protein
VLLILVGVFMVVKIVTWSLKDAIVVETKDKDGAFSVNLGNKRIFEFRGGRVDHSARKAAETYLKSHYPNNWSITNEQMPEPGHAIFDGTYTVGDEEHAFHLHVLKKGPKWVFEKLDPAEEGE